MVHHHVFNKHKNRIVQMCQSEDCTHLVIGKKNGGFRELTAEELLAITAIMFEDICIAQAMQIVHGPERGMKRAREVLGYK